MQTHPSSVMLFAAGFGTRMKTLTRDCPKPMIKVAGRSLIDYALDLARELSPDRIVANLHYKPEQLQAHLEPQGVLLSHETPEILDTGGGLRQAIHLLGNGPVFTMNTDVIWAGPNPLELARDAWDPDIMDALLVCVPLARAMGRKGAGDFTADPQGRISRGGDLVYGGVQIVKTSGLQTIEKNTFSLNELWNQMHDANRLFALQYPGHWCDVGYPEGIEIAESLLKSYDV
ncbi:nucleotidyltransferase family protein [Parasedimentitalea marina]|uniref:Nucleotidyltransferase family protein n=1 Tax=Parasedimentitalea marina TaxID=2483033 RepID=A0A3T0N7R7_9RHOB|nr:nucleotidyltransferase family protein [Parasedimentitalea marina]AZV80084.1 nucleotidyltransferase family protein [Parasedimentitalea marina]